MTDAALYAAADSRFARKRRVAFAIPAVILIYLVYVFFAFDIPGLAERARLLAVHLSQPRGRTYE